MLNPSPSDLNLSARPPILSIVIPALEADVELGRCVAAIRAACPDSSTCEIIVVVPRRQVEAARAQLPAERIVTETHPSIYGAMNDGIGASAGQYLFFLGKDDIVLPPFGEVLPVLTERSPSALFFNVYWGTQGVYSGRPSRWVVLVRNLCHQGIIYSKEVVSKHGPYVRKMRVQADHLLNIRLLWDRHLQPRVHYLERSLVWYSGAGFSVQTAKDPVFWRLYPATLKRYVGRWAACVLVTSRKLRGR